MSDENRFRVERTDLPDTDGIKQKHVLIGNVPLTDEEMIERFTKSLKMAREQKVRVLITAFELDPTVSPRAVTWFSGTPKTRFTSALVGMVEFMNFVLHESGNNKGAAAGVFREMARLAASAFQHEQHG